MVSAEDVAALVLKHKGKNYVSKDVFADLGPGYFPVGTESAPKTVNLNNRVIFPVHIKQLPLIVGNVTTGHKLQGDTMPEMGTGLIKTGGSMSCSPGSKHLKVCTSQLRWKQTHKNSVLGWNFKLR